MLGVSYIQAFLIFRVLLSLHLWRTQLENPLSGPGSDREIIRILSKQLYLGTDDRLHFASFRASDSSFEGTVVTGLVDLVE